MGLTQGQKINVKKALNNTKKTHTLIMLKSTFHIQDVTGMHIYTTNNTAATYNKTNARNARRNRNSTSADITHSIKQGK